MNKLIFGVRRYEISTSVLEPITIKLELVCKNALPKTREDADIFYAELSKLLYGKINIVPLEDN